MCYFIPAIFNSLGIISAEESQTYYIASRYLLPASLLLMTLSIDLKAIYNLGYKALVMFFTGTVGIIIGGPISIMILSIFFPELFNGAGPDAVLRGLSTLAGSWIGGGANQAAMLEIFEYNPQKYGGMVLVDIVVANIWMALILFGIGKKKEIKICNCMPLYDIPPGTVVHNVELVEGSGGKLARSAGSSVTLSGFDGDYAIIKLSSGESRKIRSACKGTIGSVYSLLDGEYEFIEAKILEGSGLLNKKIKEKKSTINVQNKKIKKQKRKEIIPNYFLRTR